MDGRYAAVLDGFIDAEEVFDGLAAAFSDIRECIAAIDPSKEIAAHEMLAEAPKAVRRFHDEGTAYLISLTQKSDMRLGLENEFRRSHGPLLEQWTAASRSARRALDAVAAQCPKWFPDMDFSPRGSDDGSPEYLVLAKIGAARELLAQEGACVTDVFERRVPELVGDVESFEEIRAAWNQG